MKQYIIAVKSSVRQTDLTLNPVLRNQQHQFKNIKKKKAAKYPQSTNCCLHEGVKMTLLSFMGMKLTSVFTPVTCCTVSSVFAGGDDFGNSFEKFACKLRQCTLVQWSVVVK